MVVLVMHLNPHKFNLLYNLSTTKITSNLFVTKFSSMGVMDNEGLDVSDFDDDSGIICPLMQQDVRLPQT
jgi:hypothetical protein